MRLVIGGAFQGKTEYVKRQYHIEDECQYINGLHKIIKTLLEDLKEKETDTQNNQSDVNYIADYFLNLCRQNPNLILICDEVGNGIVPMEKAERDWRECVGRVLCILAKEADSVERVQCGIPRILKRTVYITFVRHGATAGNLEKRYIGTTDEPLCEEGRRRLLEKKNAGAYPGAGRVITSPMKRCLETAELLYPDVMPEVYPEFRETDFGLFEGKSHEDLMRDEKLRPLYQAWIDSGGILSFPEGESMEETKRRCTDEFDKFLTNLTSDAVVIAHGGTIMSILQQCTASGGDFYDHQCDNGGGYLCRVELTGDGRLYQMKVEREI